MALDRVIQLDVGLNNNLGLRISALNIGFEIERSIDISSNTANFQIYNAKEQTRNEILKKGNNILLKAGYTDEDNLGLIFSGIITSSNSRKEASEWITEIQATDIGNNTENILKETISLSYIASTNLIQVVGDLSTTIGVPISGIENANVILNNGFVYVGNVTGAIRKVQKTLLSNNKSLYFDLGEFVIYNIGIQNSKFGIVQITQNSGLVGEVEEINDDTGSTDEKKRISFTSLMNPKIKPNSVIILKTEKINGAFITEKCIFAGDNFGGDFFVNVECVE